jgi:hypothetical protein
MDEVAVLFIVPKRRHRGGRWCGEGNGRRLFIKVPVTEEEVRVRPFDEGEIKGVGCRFGSTPTGCGRAAYGGAWHGGAPREAAVARASKGGRRRRASGGPWVGVAGWAKCHLGRRREKTKKKNGMGCKDDWAKIKGGLQKIPFQILNQGFEFK